MFFAVSKPLAWTVSSYDSVLQYRSFADVRFKSFFLQLSSRFF